MTTTTPNIITLTAVDVEADKKRLAYALADSLSEQMVQFVDDYADYSRSFESLWDVFATNGIIDESIEVDLPHVITLEGASGYDRQIESYIPYNSEGALHTNERGWSDYYENDEATEDWHEYAASVTKGLYDLTKNLTEDMFERRRDRLPGYREWEQQWADMDYDEWDR